MGKKQAKPAVPPKEAPEPAAGGKTWSANLTLLLDAVHEKFPDVERRDARMVDEPALLVTPGRVLELAKFLYGFEKLPMNYCRCVTGTDKVDKFEVVYNLASMHLGKDATSEGFERLALVVVVNDRENPVTPGRQVPLQHLGRAGRIVHDQNRFLLVRLLHLRHDPPPGVP